VRASASAQATLAGLQKRLHLQNLPRRIECYDISNISGSEPVGSMVVALDAELAPREYRTFAIRSMDTPNDFAMMTEVLDRRFRRAQDSGGPRPDLVLVDGGRGQLKMAQQVMADLGIHDVELASLAKARTLDADDLGPSQHSDERVFLPGVKNALSLPQNCNELYLLVRLRDEAHRVAITLHRKRRQARTVHSTLDAIPGVGAARKKALLLAFGSLKGIAAADFAAVAAVPGIGAEVARRVLLALATN
jgi:excinuclease ABC subunit C